MDSITIYFVILGVLGIAFGAFFFRYGKNSSFIEYIEQQYGKRKAWTGIILTFTLLIAIRILMWVIKVDNPWY